MKTLKPFDRIINGINCNFAQHGRYYRLEFTDSRSGDRFRKSTGTDNPTAAEAFANNITVNWVPGVSTMKKITVTDLVMASLQTEANNERQYDDTLSRWQLRLCAKFGSWEARDLKTNCMEDYKLWGLNVACDDNSTSLRKSWKPITECTATRTVTKKNDDGTTYEKSYEVKLDVLEEASINKDLIVLSKAFTRAYKLEEISFMPSIPLFPKEELNVREGTLELDEFDRVMELPEDVLPLGIRALLQTYRDSGSRSAELKNAKVSQLVKVYTEEGEAGLIKLAPGKAKASNGKATTKNSEGREVPLSVAAYELVKECIKGKEQDEHIFTRDERKGEKVGDFRKLWAGILEQAGIDRWVLMHDLRRTSTVEFEEAEVSREVAMDTQGHKTPDVYGRYNVRNRKRLFAGMRKKEAWQKRQRELREGKAGTPSQAELIALLQRQIEEGKAREAALQAALAALQQAVQNLTLAQTAPASAQQRREQVQ